MNTVEYMSTRVQTENDLELQNHFSKVIESNILLLFQNEYQGYPPAREEVQEVRPFRLELKTCCFPNFQCTIMIC